MVKKQPHRISNGRTFQLGGQKSTDCDKRTDGQIYRQTDQRRIQAHMPKIPKILHSKAIKSTTSEHDLNAEIPIFNHEKTTSFDHFVRVRIILSGLFVDLTSKVLNREDLKFPTDNNIFTTFGYFVVLPYHGAKLYNYIALSL